MEPVEVNMQKNNIIQVAYVLDDHYAEPTCVSMASMLINTKHCIHFHVISSRLSDANKVKIIELSSRFPNGRWSFHRFEFDTSFMKTTNYLTAETYYRIYLPLILPDIARVIYIDGDTVVNGDVFELWSVDLADKTVGMVPHCYATLDIEMHRKILEIDESKPYCNCGVLLIDLKKFILLGLHQKLEKLIELTYKKFESQSDNVGFFADQEVLNYVLYQTNQIKYLPYRYNAMLIPDEPANDEIGFGLPELAAAHYNPVIIHYGGYNRVWSIENCLKSILLPFIKLYYYHKKQTPFYDVKDDLRIEKYTERYGFTFKYAIINYWSFLATFAKEILDISAIQIKKKASNKKIIYYGAGKSIKTLMVFFATNDIYPSAMVDGSVSKQGSSVYGYAIEAPDKIFASPNDFFVVITVQSTKTASGISDILISHGFLIENIYHAYKFAADRMNEDIIQED
jgi:lipopolysaccharide biosynthesis glycosyltransferase